METTGVTPPGMGSTGSAPQGSSMMGRDQFLKLLVTQLAHQDPLSPMQGTEFVAQLATFSSLEQQMNMSDRLQALALSQTASIGAQAVGFVGKGVIARGGSFALDAPPAEGVRPAEKLLIEAPAGGTSSAVLTVLDKDGNVVATRDLGPLKKGRNEIEFDGKDKDGNPLPAGSYTYRVEAKDAAGVAVEVTPLTRGLVEAVVYSGGAPTLKIGGRDVPLGEVMEVSR